jgi:hypothetical protein
MSQGAAAPSSSIATAQEEQIIWQFATHEKPLTLRSSTRTVVDQAYAFGRTPHSRLNVAHHGSTLHHIGLIEIYKTNPIFLRDRAAFVIKPAGGQGCERFTRVGEDRGRAR